MSNVGVSFGLGLIKMVPLTQQLAFVDLFQKFPARTIQAATTDLKQLRPWIDVIELKILGCVADLASPPQSIFHLLMDARAPSPHVVAHLFLR